MNEKKLPLGVLVSGRGSNLEAILKGCAAGTLPAEVKVVVSNRKGVPALKKAESYGVLGVAVCRQKGESRSSHETRVARVLKESRVDLVVLAGYDLLVGPALLDEFPQKIINVHPALLPAFPGLFAQRQALLYGVKVSGASVIFVDETVDGGPIIVQEAVDVLEGDTEESLAARILEVEHRILPEAITLIARGRVTLEGRRVSIRKESSL